MSRFVLAGGGTGGHVMPALALAEVMRDAGDEVLLIGTRRGLETRVVPAAGFALETLDSRGLVGKGLVERIRNGFALLRATFAARRLLRGFRPDAVICVGGYASVPPGLAAALGRRPLQLVNVDAVPGAANRLLARFADDVCVGFESAAAALRRRPDEARVAVTGVPLRAALREAVASAGERTPDGRRHLFVFGGSLGAQQLNEAMLAALPSLDPATLAIVHQTGEAQRERVEAAYRDAGFDAEVVAFENDMPARYRWADLVVCRAGALTIAELALAGRPSLLVPLAHVGGGEQFANAAVLEKADAARVLDSRDLTPDAFVQELRTLLADADRLHEMGRHAAAVARPDAAHAIVARARALVGEGSR